MKKHLKKAKQLKEKLLKSKGEIDSQAKSLKALILIEELNYYEMMLDKHIDLLERRIIKGGKIPHEEKVFSIFEPYTEWIQKGKSGNRVELGLKIAIGTDQYGFILAHRVMEKEGDVEVAVWMVQKIKKNYALWSTSFDRGFWSPSNKAEIEKLVEMVVMPKKGKRNREESENERSKKFKQLRKQHSGIESNINSLEHHGLNRCPDKGIENFKRYAALGILAYNLHLLGKILIAENKNTRCQKAA